MPSRTTRTAYRLARPALALALVVAQAMAAFGFPLVRPAHAGRAGACGSGACGCDSVCGVSDGCCCLPTALPPPAPQPAVVEECGRCGRDAADCCCHEPEPESQPAHCPKCRDREAAKPTCPLHAAGSAAACSHSRSAEPDSAPAVKWVAGWKARQCHGDGPLGLLAEIPAVPPACPARPAAGPAPAGVVRLVDLSSSSHVSALLDPPPRSG